MKKVIKKTRQHSFVLLVLGIIPFCFALYLLLQGASLPFVGYNAWNFNAYSLIAHNYNLFGLFATHFAPIISVEKLLPLRPEYYLNHPPLEPLLQSFSFRLFGESFFSARIPVVFASLGSMLLLFWIGKITKNIRFGILTLFVSSVIPATSIFGRMIGQEPVVLFFCLLLVVTIIKYRQKGSARYVFFAYLAVVLGSLTDWPMVYFTCCLFIYLSSVKMKRLGIGLLVTATIVTLGYLLYVSKMEGETGFLVNGFLNRSLGEVTKKHDWLFVWVGTIFLRFFLYFNPFFVLLSLWFLIIEGKFFLFKKRIKGSLCVSFFIFGAMHIFFYPEGSFGHPYWMYYLLPFVVLASSEKLYEFLQKKSYFYLLVIFLLSTIYVLLINAWKMNEIKGNLFRFKVAEMAASQVSPYQDVLLNENSLIDPDMLSYQFKIRPKVLSSEAISQQKFSYILFSCWNMCDLEAAQILQLRRQFLFTEYKTQGADLLIFSRDEKPSKNMLPKKVLHFDAQVPQSNESVFKMYYRYIMQRLSLPQV